MNDSKILMITSYPPKETSSSSRVGGLAWFAKKAVESMDSTRFTILAEILDTPESYSEGENDVVRVWSRGRIRSFFKLISELHTRRTSHEKLMVQFEFGIFGNEYVTGFFPLVLISAKLFGYEVILVQHQVLTNLGELSGHLGASSNSLVTRAKNFLTSLYLRLNCTLVHKVVVFDEIHKEKLSLLTNRNKIDVIPIGVEQTNLDNLNPFRPPKLTGGFKEDKFTLMTFGFVAWYKGTDWLVEQFNKYSAALGTDNDYQLLVAGGESPTQKETDTYKSFYTSLLNEVGSNAGQIFHTGFVDEAEIPFYFMKSDLVILPYRVLMSSSGPLSLALTYERPFMLSDILEPYTHTEDFKRVMGKLGLGGSEFIFSLEKGDLFEKVERIRKDQELYSKLTTLSRRLKEERSWEKIGKQYELVLQK